MNQDEPPDWFTELADRQSQENVAAPPPTPPLTAEARKRRSWKRGLTAIIATVLVAALVGTYAFLTLSAPVGSASAAVFQPTVPKPDAAKIALPTIGEAAVSISGADDYLGPTASGVFATSGGSTPLPMASISKLVTAMVVLSARPLGASGKGRTIAWTKADTALYDKYYLLNATIAPMKTGTSMTEHDAIEAMLVVSACNYAEAMANWAFGSNAGFVSATKRWLRAHGLTSTTIVEPTGLDDHNTSTPSDLITLGKLAMADPQIAAMVALPSTDVPALGGMANTNDLLGSDGVNGIKTGTLDSAGADLLFSASVPVGTSQPLHVIGAILGGQNHGQVDSEVRALIASIKAGFHDEQLGVGGQLVGKYSTPWGSKASMVLAKGASVFTWSNTPITAKMTTTTIKSGKSGETVGSVTWTAGKTTVTVPVTLQGTITPPTAWWRLTHPAQVLG